MKRTGGSFPRTPQESQGLGRPRGGDSAGQPEAELFESLEEAHLMLTWAPGFLQMRGRATFRPWEFRGGRSLRTPLLRRVGGNLQPLQSSPLPGPSPSPGPRAPPPTWSLYFGSGPSRLPPATCPSPAPAEKLAVPSVPHGPSTSQARGRFKCCP